LFAQAERIEQAALILGLVLVFIFKNTWQLTQEVNWLKTTVLVVLLVTSISFLFGNVTHPFLYYQF
jgi:hypothetical protein